MPELDISTKNCIVEQDGHEQQCDEVEPGMAPTEVNQVARHETPDLAARDSRTVVPAQKAYFFLTECEADADDYQQRYR